MNALVIDNAGLCLSSGEVFEPVPNDVVVSERGREILHILNDVFEDLEASPAEVSHDVPTD